MILLLKKWLTDNYFKLLLAVFVIPRLTFSQEFLPYDTEQLNSGVSVANTTLQRISETPAMVSRYEANHLAAFGLTNLKEMLSFIPHIILQDGIGSEVTSIMLRGVTEQYGQRVLFLVNGVPYWAPAHSNIPLLGIPIEAISHIEVIRGPHTVYYGSNASGGVINLVTKDNAINTLTVKVGANGLINGSGYWQHKFNHNKSLSIAAEAQGDNGYSAKLIGVTSIIDTQNKIAEEKISKSEKMQSILVKYNHYKFHAMAQTYQSKTNNHDVISSLAVAAEVKKTGYLLHSNYSWPMGTNKITIYSDYNNFYFQANYNNLLTLRDFLAFRFDNSGRDNYRWRSGANIQLNLSPSFSAFAGIEYEKRATAGFFIYDSMTQLNVQQIIKADEDEEKSIFAQLAYRFQYWHFTLGGRFTKNDHNDDKSTPQAAIIYKLSGNHSIKLLYSRGFSSPNFSQTSLVNTESAEVPAALASDLSEDIEGIDLAYTYQNRNNLFVASAYLVDDKDFIQLYSEQNIARYRNFTAGDRYGLELEFQRDMPNYLFFANLTYSHTHKGHHDITNAQAQWFIPRITANLGSQYKINSHHAIGASVRAQAKRNHAKQLYQLNINYQFIQQAYELHFTIRNALDEQILTPDVVNYVDEQLITSADGLNVLLEAKLSY